MASTTPVTPVFLYYTMRKQWLGKKGKGTLTSSLYFVEKINLKNLLLPKNISHRPAERQLPATEYNTM